jgi:hypothetical protein
LKLNQEVTMGWWAGVLVINNIQNLSRTYG